ncbi:acyl-CoA dehydrogenase family protein [Spongiibacter taiwanensis]|uniref:acyl-CoA dehydrogenase family protein n=1 Tax=Spongiibacter taiwanensis TaxID=1748242 RepID=UPI0020362173|nr:acyl-CoA dehydrogenase family protein [Spongiibacter taiwanensis]USA41678.1 acyl-CoA dehydrogenase family protein [Spongiibacter taiwanensis]
MILTTDQQQIANAVSDFATDVLAPNYQRREQLGVLDRELVKQMGSLGFLGSDLPENLGGLGLDAVTAGLIAERMAYGDFNLSALPVNVSLLGAIISRHASADIQAQWLPEMVAGRAIVAICLTEPRGGSDAAALQMRARRDGDDYLLNGEKASITFADCSDASVVFARTDHGERANGVSAFFVPHDLPGISRGRYDDLGSTVIGRGSIFYDDVRIPARYRLGDEGQGFTQVMQGFDYSRALIGLQCCGAAQASLDEAWAYSKEREAFGRPIAQFQGVSFPLAEAESTTAAIRQLCYHTLALRDADLPHTAEAAMCKWMGPRKAVETIHQCLLTFGHYGWSKDLPHQQRLRDVMGLEIGDGTAGIMKQIIAKERVGRAAIQY